MADQRFPKSHRLRTRPEFKTVFDRGAVRKDGRLVTYLLATGAPVTRLGIVVGKAARGSVSRNRIKRLIREGFRLLRAGLPVGMDVIVLPRRGAKLSLEGVKQSLGQLLARLPPPPPPLPPEGTKSSVGKTPGAERKKASRTGKRPAPGPKQGNRPRTRPAPAPKPPPAADRPSRGEESSPS